MKKALMGLGCVVGVIILVALGYVIYAFTYYHRIPDNMELTVSTPQSGTDSLGAVPIDETLKITSYNIGFGAYLPDFSFFMDGGVSGRAKSGESVIHATAGAADYILAKDPDFAVYQEVDLDGTRSHHVNQVDALQGAFHDYVSVFAQNYDSFYIAIPLTEPHGSNKSGLVTLSKYDITSSLRRSFPVSDGFGKMLDLDRCFSVSRIPTANGKELVLINLHTSAYGNSDEVREGQLKMLYDTFTEEYAKGNYCIAGGDYNHNLVMDENFEGEFLGWCYPFPRSTIPEHFSFAMDILTDEEKAALNPTNRDSSVAYVEGQTETFVLDSFIVSDNIEVISYENLTSGFAYSDHEPVYMEFKLK